LISIRSGRFKKGMAVFLEAAEKERLKLAEARVDTLVANLTAVTPVDTGYAASRWEKRPGSKPGKWVVVNDAPYIGRLNAGSSQQAPSHFIEREALEVGKPNGAVVRYTK
jgi:hypothetical protein